MAYVEIYDVLLCICVEENLHIQPQKQPPEVFCKKGALKNFAKLIGKYLCQRVFFNKVAGLGLQLY